MKNIDTKKRERRIRNKLKKVNTERFRLTVFRSNKNIYAQIVDDAEGRTIVSASTLENSEALADPGLAKKEASSVVGRVVAERARAAGVDKVFFDRGKYLYHGRVRALADAARDAGLNF